MNSTCGMCAMSMPADILNFHMFSAHKNEANFRVTCDKPGCNKVYTNWKSYRQHNWRKHNRNLRDLNDFEEGSSDSGGDNDDHLDHDIDEPYVEQPLPLPDLGQPPLHWQFQTPGNLTPSERLMYHTSLFIANLRENLLVPQSTMDVIIEGSCKLVKDYLQITEDALLGDEPDESIPTDTVKEAFRNCKPDDFFKKCSTPHRVMTFMKEKLNRVAPEKISIGKQFVWSKTGQLVEKEYFAYIPPFLESLQLCLNNPDILHCVDNPLPHQEGVLRTVLDGQYYRDSNVFKNDPKALGFEFYQDDVEYTNALGSKTHKVSMFYWVLLNIHPQYRSTHRVHNLLAITTSENLKRFGAKPILANFIEAINKLGQAEGVKLLVGNEERVFHGLLVFVAGDTPASSFLGGFKETVGGARKPCRRCLISKEEVKCNFDAVTFLLRNDALHRDHLRTVFQEGLTLKAQQFWSKQYGIKSESCLTEISNFDVTTCLPHDFMHVVLEGTLASHITQFIKFCVNNGKFTLQDFNNSLVNFDFCCFIRDKPSRIEKAHLENGIRQNAVQMLVLGQTLPFLIRRYVDDSMRDHLSVFILLMQIVNKCLAFVLLEDDVDDLTLMLECHHERFKALYGDSAITPKWHYFLHIGEQILLFGPPRQQWCMRLEALHSYFKEVSRRLKNFRNLPFSLANRKQNRQCVDYSFVPGTVRKSFLCDGNKVTRKTSKNLNDYDHSDLVRQIFPNIPENEEIVVASNVEVLGAMYKTGLGILIEIDQDTFPIFGKIVEMVLWDEKIAILYSVLETLNYDGTLNAYEVIASDPAVVSGLSVDNLVLRHSLPILKSDSDEFLILTYHRRTEFSG